MKKLIVILTLLIAAATASNAQWQQTNGPDGGFVISFAISGTNIFAGTHGYKKFCHPSNSMFLNRKVKPQSPMISCR